MRKLLYIYIAFQLQGCINYQPVPDGYIGDLAGIKDGFTQVSSTKVHFYQLLKIDGRKVETSAALTGERNYGQGLRMSVVVTERMVPATKSILTLQAMTYVAAPILVLGGGIYSVSGDVEVMLKKNENYFVMGELSKSYSAVWLEDAFGNLVSEKIEKNQTDLKLKK